METVARLLEKALLHYEKNETKKAEKLLDELIRELPNFDRALFMKGVILEDTGRAEEAAAYFDRLVNLGNLWLRLAMQLQERDTQKALACYERSIGVDPILNHAWYHKGLLLERLGKHDEAAGCFRNVSPWREIFSKVFIPSGFAVFLAAGGYMMMDRGEKVISWLAVAMSVFCLFWLKRDAGAAVGMLMKKLKAK